MTAPVAPAPHRPFADARRVLFGPSPAERKSVDGELRIASHNILADAYSHTWGGLYPYLSPAAAAADYRMQLALADVRGLSADIVCMQEVDTRWFERFWRPAMEADGYEVRNQTPCYLCAHPPSPWSDLSAFNAGHLPADDGGSGLIECGTRRADCIDLSLILLIRRAFTRKRAGPRRRAARFSSEPPGGGWRRGARCP